MRSGLGIRPELFGPVADSKPELGFFEAHSENYFGQSMARSKLLELRADYPISLHGVGLSLGRADDLDPHHLKKLKRLIDEVQPFLVSEHLAWSAYSHRHLPDLLPLPLTSEAMQIMSDHVNQMQDSLQRQVLVENPSNYLLFDRLQIPEPEFLNELAQRTGCGLLLDVNNVHVSSQNVGRDPKVYLQQLNPSYVKQYHLAGYTELTRQFGEREQTVLIDTHNHPVYPPVWTLFDYALQRFGLQPCLVEWDSDFPAFDVLLAQCDMANQYLESVQEDNASSTADVVTVAQQADARDTSESVPLANFQDDFLTGLLQLKPKLDTAKEQYRSRYWIYQNNVYGALQDYLASIYPATQGLVGADFFKQMVSVFVQKNPPQEGDIHTYGEQFYSVCTQLEGLASLVYLPDVMRYEWALHQIYYAHDTSAINSAELAQEIGQQALLERPIALRPAIKIIESQYPICSIHEQSLPDYAGEVGVDLAQSQDTILVTRYQGRVRSRLLSATQFTFIDRLKSSNTLLQAIDALQGSVSPEDIADALTLVFELGLLSETKDAQAA